MPHAFGGAIALAFWTEEPRGTRDLDINLFLRPDEAGRVRDALPPGVGWSGETDTVIARDGQARVFWDETPLDLFFDYAPIHEEAARNARRVPFAGAEIPVLGPTELAVFKAMFDRTRDWADIEAMLSAGTLDLDAVRAGLGGLVDRDDPRWARLQAAERAAAGD